MALKTYEGNFVVKGRRFGIVVARFNEFITRRLLDGAVDQLRRHGVPESSIDVAWVPGSFEIPFACHRMAVSKKYDVLIALGCVIRGETDHYEVVVQEASNGIGSVARETGIPIICGIITADRLEQAIDRAGAKSGNKGAEAALAAMEMANWNHSFEAKSKTRQLDKRRVGARSAGTASWSGGGWPLGRLAPRGWRGARLARRAKKPRARNGRGLRSRLF